MTGSRIKDEADRWLGYVGERTVRIGRWMTWRLEGEIRNEVEDQGEAWIAEAIQPMDGSRDWLRAQSSMNENYKGGRLRRRKAD
jgi:hypothetical protein